MELITGLKTVIPAALVFLAIWFLAPIEGEVVKALVSFGGAVAGFFAALKLFGKKPASES